MTDVQRDNQRHPALPVVVERMSADLQLRVADAITAFAGSMYFVYLHAVVFIGWMLVLEKSPWPALTLIVSMEAIFLSTFVIIAQNWQGAFCSFPAAASSCAACSRAAWSMREPVDPPCDRWRRDATVRGDDAEPGTARRDGICLRSGAAAVRTPDVATAGALVLRSGQEART